MTLQRLAGALMVLSGITHPSQILLYGTTPEVVQPSLVGALFLPLGLWLLSGRRAPLWVGVAFPLVGGIASVLRILDGSPNPLTHFHATIDFVVVGLCAMALVRKRPQA